MDWREILEGFLSIYYQKGDSNYFEFFARTLRHLPYFSPETFFTQIQKLSHTYQAHFTFFVLGKVASARKSILGELEAAGHEIASHSFHHYSSLSLSEKAFQEEMVRSLDALSFLKKIPLGYRSPHLFFKEGHYDILEKLGFRYSSSQFGSKSEPLQVRKNLVEVPVHFMDCHTLGYPQKMEIAFQNSLFSGAVHALHPYIALHPKYEKRLFTLFNKSPFPLISIREKLAGKPGICMTFDIGF